MPTLLSSQSGTRLLMTTTQVNEKVENSTPASPKTFKPVVTKIWMGDYLADPPTVYKILSRYNCPFLPSPICENTHQVTRLVMRRPTSNGKALSITHVLSFLSLVFINPPRQAATQWMVIKCIPGVRSIGKPSTIYIEISPIPSIYGACDIVALHTDFRMLCFPNFSVV